MPLAIWRRLWFRRYLTPSLGRRLQGKQGTFCISGLIDTPTYHSKLLSTSCRTKLRYHVGGQLAALYLERLCACEPVNTIGDEIRNVPLLSRTGAVAISECDLDRNLARMAFYGGE